MSQILPALNGKYTLPVFNGNCATPITVDLKKPRTIVLFNPAFYRFIGLDRNYVNLSQRDVGTALDAMGHKVYSKNLEIGDTGEHLGYVGYEGRAKGHDDYLREVKNPDHPVWKDFRKTIEDIRPDTIGFTVLNVKVASVNEGIAIAREYPFIKDILVGGVQPTESPESWAGKGVHVIPGEFEGHGHSTSRYQNRLENLNGLPRPNYDLLLDEYRPEGYGHLLSTRGCPYGCTFCDTTTVWKRKVTFMDTARIMDEMQYIEDRFKPPAFTFWDEVFSIKKDRVASFAKEYQTRGIKTPWRCDTRADLLTEEVLDMLIGAGCKQLSLGIETGSDETLRRIGKGETLADFSRAAELLNRKGMEWKAYAIVGFPHETIEDILQTVTYIKSLQPNRITLSRFTPYKGTKLWDECVAQGLVDPKTFDPTLYAHQSNHNLFTRNMTLDEYNAAWDSISRDVDAHNKSMLLRWM